MIIIKPKRKIIIPKTKTTKKVSSLSLDLKKIIKYRFVFDIL